MDNLNDKAREVISKDDMSLKMAQGKCKMVFFLFS